MPLDLSRQYRDEDRGYKTPCWIWLWCKDVNGYGRVRVDGAARLAHRATYILLRGDVPANLELDHLCRQPACINPDHLEPVTHLENMRRGEEANRTHCPQGHTYDETNTYVRKDESRQCRSCHVIQERQRRLRLRGQLA